MARALFAAIASYVWISRSVPETKAPTLEEIQTMFGLGPGGGVAYERLISTQRVIVMTPVPLGA